MISEYNMKKKGSMTIRAIDKNSSATMTDGFLVDDHLEDNLDDFLGRIPFLRYYVETDPLDFELTEEQFNLLDRLDIDVFYQ